MATSKETALQKRIQKAVKIKFYPAWVIKYHGDQMGKAGVPDLLCCVKGLFIPLEVKLPGKKPSKIQLEEIADINKAGGHATYVTSVKQAIQHIRKVIKANGL